MDVCLNIRRMAVCNNKDLESFMTDMKVWETQQKNKEEEVLSTIEDIYGLSSSDEQVEEDEEKENSLKYFKQGNEFMEKGKWSRAIHCYTMAIKLYGEESIYYSNRALAYLKQNQPQSAEDDCTIALKFNNKSTKALMRRAAARKSLGKYIGSCGDMLHVLKLDPENKIVEAEYNALVPYTKTTNDDETLVTEVITEEDNLFLAQQEKESGNKFLAQNKLDQAIDKYTAAIQLNSSDSTFYANRAICYMKAKKWELAEQDCCQALELDANYGKVYVRRARVRQSQGNLSAALEDMQQALKLSPNNRNIQKELNEIQTQLETKDKRNIQQSQSRNVSSASKPLSSRSVQVISTGTSSGNKGQDVSSDKRLNSDSDNTRNFIKYEEIYPIQKRPHQRSSVKLRSVEVKESNAVDNDIYKIDYETIKNLIELTV